MPVTSNRKITITFENDIEYSQAFDAIQNGSSPGAIDVVGLIAGANTITVPSGSTGATIIPPSTNTETMTLKGVSGDTGIALALTSPTSIALATVTTFVITAGGVISLKIIWS